MAHFHKIGKTDWCLVEIEVGADVQCETQILILHLIIVFVAPPVQIALKLNKLIIPLYPGSQGQAFIGAEMSRIMHIESAKVLWGLLPIRVLGCC